MKTKNLKKIVICLLAGLLTVGAQQTRAADAKPTVSVTLSQLNAEFHTLRDNLASTMMALGEVKAAAANAGDLDKTFAGFSSAYGVMEAQVAKIREHGTATKARAKEHWEAWQKELTEMVNPN